MVRPTSLASKGLASFTSTPVTRSPRPANSWAEANDV